MNFYDSIIEGAMRLAPEVRGQLYTAALEYLYTDGKLEPDLDAMDPAAAALFVSHKVSFDRQLAKELAGRKGGKASGKKQPERKQTASKAQADAKQKPTEQEQEQEQEKEPNVSVSGETDTSARERVVAHLNAVTGGSYRAGSKSTARPIDARLREGHSVEDLCHVVDLKARQWMGTDMAKYLRPETLFGGKFEGYLSEWSRAGPAADGWRVFDDYEVIDEGVAL